MHGYEVIVRHESLGSQPPHLERVYCLADDENAAIFLVRTALRLTGQTVQVVRTISHEEVQKLGLKPFQVRHG